MPCPRARAIACRQPSTWKARSRSGHWPTSSTSCCVVATLRQWMTSMADGLTPSQTIGPFYWGTVVSSYRADLAPLGVAGERIELALTLHDVDGKVVADGLLELWQANS